MPNFTSRVRIDAPLETVFDFATDLEKARSWMPQITRIERLDQGPLRAGSRFRETRRIGKREATAVIQVSAHERPSVHRASSSALGVQCEYEFRFLPDGESTTVELIASAQGRWFGKLLAPMFLKMIQKEDGEMLERLKVAVEGQAIPA